MEENLTRQKPDTLLLPLLNSGDERETENALADLLAKQVEPTIERTLRAKLRVSLKPTDFSQTNQDALELLSEVKLLLVFELGKLKLNAGGKIIQNLNSYVTSVTINAYRQYLRAKYPLRQQLKNKLRYLLTHHPKFSLWENENRAWLCGFKEFRFQNEKIKPPDIGTIHSTIIKTVNNNNLSDSKRTIDLLAIIFEYSKVPVAFNDLISIVAEIYGIRDQKEMPEIDLNQQEPAEFVNKTLTEIEQQENLKKIWEEIRQLPIRHRLALLLNLRDKQGDAGLHIFPLLRIASIRQIAETLEFSAEEFARIWNELPWEDLKIAGHLGLTRQQVINLRQSARARLVRLFARRD